ncbi:ABC transporter permease [Paenibacillus sp. MMS18-CY102]|uniref:ABC transporter permease n=1 Tax=Paenibacillus sp. MMS18-CY102 TaxID=2682849 RepID=UPI00136603EE|nr:FtsX-like permease family protein [Paenibacillus sp. MMS18-CY102]MWC30167.1 FtsX-like permease family protein [Paenibacillus sp. MMS18-CY102]
MLRSSLTWKMAALHLRRQWKQALLAIIGGSIGAILIGLSFSFYYSLVHSGDMYIEAHYGAIDWELQPDGLGSNQREDPFSNSFSSEQAAEIEKPLHNMAYAVLPIVRSDVQAKLAAAGGNTKEGIVIPHLQLLGFDPERAAGMERNQLLWSLPLKDDDLIIDQPTADQYGIANGQIVQLTDKGGKHYLFRVHTAKEQGLTGYRQGTNQGTAIVQLSMARKLIGLAEGRFTSVLVAGPPVDGINSVYPVPQSKRDFYRMESTKQDAYSKIQDLRSSYGFIFVLLAGVASIGGLLLLVQLLMMQARSRSENYGILRAIGLSRNQVRGLFVSESFMLTVLQSMAGSLVGISAGLVLIKWYDARYGEMLEHISGIVVPIQPYLSWITVLEAFGAIMFFQCAVTLIAAWVVGKQGILQLLGKAPVSKRTHRWRKGLDAVIVAVSLLIILLHLYYANTDAGVNLLQSPSFIWVNLIWLFACFALVHLAIRFMAYWIPALGAVMRRLGWPETAFFMASRYPKQELKQTYAVTLLFSLIVLAITSTVMITAYQNQYNDVDKTNQAILGYGGQLPYKTEQEKQRYLAVVQRDPLLASSIASVADVETYQLTTRVGAIPNAVFPVTEQLVREGDLPLVARSTAYANDQEAWTAVSRDNSAIILDERFMENNTVNLYKNDQRRYHVGQKITFPVYENKLRSLTEKPVPVTQKTFTVIGFARGNAEKSLSNQFYNATFVSRSVFDGLKPYGYSHTENKNKGYLLLKFDYKNVGKARAIEGALLNQGIKNGIFPYLQNGSKNVMNQQMAHIFIGFMAFTALIAVCGLAIIQMRAVQVRSKQIAMLRCIGLSNKLLVQMFLLEGFFISAVGISIGAALGSTGGYMYLRVLKLSAISAHLQEMPFNYPQGTILVIVVGIGMIAVAINWFPARKVLAIAPGEAMREAA